MFAPLVNFTHYSLQYGFSKPKELVKKCLEYGYEYCGITDLKTVSGCVEFYKECKKFGIKPILGMSLDKDTHLFAKNKSGWKELIKIHSGIETSTDNIICVSNEVNKNFKDFRLNDGSIKGYYYCNSSDQDIHRISVCSGLKLKINDVKPFEYKHIFNRDLNLPDYEDSSDLIESILIDCEDYEILGKPLLPSFAGEKTEEELLKDICRIGWVNKINPILKSEEDKRLYLERFHHEFNVIKSANLFGYFLIVADIVEYCNSQGFLTGCGRGSAAGCLISYLMDITKIDPIKYNLLFERFYNSSRNTKDNISLPDIDLDVPSSKRDIIIEYIRNKYGRNKVAQICTFGRLQGRSVLKEVLRVTDSCGFSEMNAMTKFIPDEAAISDSLEKMEDRSIIKWALINRKEKLGQFCELKEDGTLTGDYAEAFDKAIRLEGTFKNLGTHAAGIIISKNDIIESCPVINGIAQMEMGDLESISLVKLDILGVSVLSKLMRIEELIRI
jgi:DNA polymerase-3 subunit alpha